MPAAVRKLFDDLEPAKIRPMRGFKSPSVEEVSQYIREYMGWPVEFCDYYAQKFHDYYQKQAWMQSNKLPIKDWKAAFRNVWTEPKNDKDKQKLIDCIAKEKNDNPLVFLNECLDLHSKGQYKPSKPEVLSIYEFLKATGRISRNTFTKEEWDKLVEDAGNSKERGRMLTVKRLFDKMVKHNEQFKP